MSKCEHCGYEHEGKKCSLIKSIEYFENGKVKKIEYMTPADYQNMASGMYYYPVPYYPIGPMYIGPSSTSVGGGGSMTGGSNVISMSGGGSSHG